MGPRGTGRCRASGRQAEIVEPEQGSAREVAAKEADREPDRLSLANECTFLAWIRTALAFVVAASFRLVPPVRVLDTCLALALVCIEVGVACAAQDCVLEPVLVDRLVLPV